FVYDFVVLCLHFFSAPFWSCSALCLKIILLQYRLMHMCHVLPYIDLVPGSFPITLVFLEHSSILPVQIIPIHSRTF
ncbi:hypothetical protein L9F63_003007, partial [Diploptera punctata]